MGQFVELIMTHHIQRPAAQGINKSKAQALRTLQQQAAQTSRHCDFDADPIWAVPVPTWDDLPQGKQAAIRERFTLAVLAMAVSEVLRRQEG